jgi:biofilm PGA synthesis N-glycosyltransferase PgaC
MLEGILFHLYNFLVLPFYNQGYMTVILLFLPMVVFFELPWNLFIFLGLFKYVLRRKQEGSRIDFFPSVSCIVTCYNEGREIEKTVLSLLEQLYPGKLQILLVIDGAYINKSTLKVAEELQKLAVQYNNRTISVIPKWQRGGVVSSSNLGLNFVTGEIVVKVDGDSSFDNNMLERVTRHFVDPEVVAVSGCLRVRNAADTFCAGFQAIEYFNSIQLSKTALSEFNMVNNISGAFGIFRRSLLNLVEGWDAGTAEDLDITLRIKNYFNNRKEKFRIVFDPEAICFTDVPETYAKFFKQRLRWEGDYPYIIGKHWRSIAPSMMGWANFNGLLVTMFTNIVLPMMVFVYTFWLFIVFPADYAIALLMAVYSFYFVMTCLLYLLGIIFVSERKKEDLSRFGLVPFMPMFLFAAKINTLLAVFWEWIGKGHQDSSMAPWWVLRKNKF